MNGFKAQVRPAEVASWIVPPVYFVFYGKL